MDDELLQLQQQFLAAQEVKAKARLSDRNVVELVAKLKQLGLLGDDLLHSLNGKEYITQASTGTEGMKHKYPESRSNNLNMSLNSHEKSCHWLGIPNRLN